MNPDSLQGLVLLHDGSFEGFLTAVFESFRLRLPDIRIVSSSRHAANLLETPREVATDPIHARRVWNGILERAGKEVAALLRCAFRASDPGIDDSLRHHVRSLFHPCDTARGRNLLDPHVHAVHGAACRVRHEAHLMLGFVRFQEAPDASLWAVVSPEHDVVELLGPHFLARLPGHAWTIADARRGIAARSDGFRLSTLTCDPAALPRDARESARLFDSREAGWRELWTTFYDSVNIPERNNGRQMTRLLPRRYWGHLPERTRATPLPTEAPP